MQMNKRVLISGASLSGLTLAYWLSRYGFKPTVVELAPQLREAGNGVDIRGQAIEVAERMSIMQQVQAAATDVQGMSFVTKNNRVAGRINMQAIQQKHAGKEVEIMRGDLAKILYRAAKDVECIFDDSIESLQQTANGVKVEFQRGTARQFDLVIGADGIHSNVRKLVFGPEQQFRRYLGHYFAFADANPKLGENRWMTIYNEPGRMAGVYRSGNHSGAKSYFLFRSPQPLKYDFRDSKSQQALLSKAMLGMAWQTQPLLGSALADPHLYFDELCQIVMPAWSADRVALVGDAAYCASPASGAGAMLAMVGAYRLAGELAAANGDYVTAFNRYESGFHDTVKQTQSQIFVSLLAPKSQLGITLRNLLAKSSLFGTLAGVERRLQPKVKPLPAYLMG